MADERDPGVSQRYRELPREEPSRELDQSILAAAHRAADKPHAPLVTPAGRHRRYFAFGAAAILVLAVAVTVHVERERADPEAGVAPIPSAPKEDFYDRMETPPAAMEQSRRTERAESPKRVEPRKPQTPKPRPGPTPDPAPAQEAPRELARDARPMGQVAASAVPLSPERFLERIAELRKEGRHSEADQMLAEFRSRYPDYSIPKEMLEKVERKK
jgi:hypothetical protein